MGRECYMTIPVAEELERLNSYLATQPSALQVVVCEPVPDDRYIIPDSLVMIVQHAQQYQMSPLSVSIRFLNYSAEISYHIPPLPARTDSHPYPIELADLYRNYFCFPSVRRADGEETVSIPLFI